MSNYFTDCLYQFTQPPAVYEKFCCSRSLSTFIISSFKHFSHVDGNVALAITVVLFGPLLCSATWVSNQGCLYVWISETALLFHWPVYLSLHKTHSLTFCGFQIGLVLGQKLLPSRQRVLVVLGFELPYIF